MRSFYRCARRLALAALCGALLVLAATGAFANVTLIAPSGPVPGVVYGASGTAYVPDATGAISVSTGADLRGLLDAGWSLRSKLTAALTPTGNGADTTEDTLQTYALPANTLNANGKGLKIRCPVHFATNSDTKTTKLYFGSEVIATPAAATSNKNGYLELEVYRTGPSTQIVVGRGLVDTTAVTPYVATGAENDQAAITIKCTGTAGTGNANDITAEAMIVEPVN